MLNFGEKQIYRAGLGIFFVYLALVFIVTYWNSYPQVVGKIFIFVFSCIFLVLFSILWEDKNNDIEIDDGLIVLIARWKYYLNEVIGLFSFGGAISAICTNYPRAVSLSYIVFIFIYSIKSKKDNDIDIVDFVSKKYSDANVRKDVLDKIATEYLSVPHAVVEFWPFWCGYLALLYVVMFMPNVRPFWEVVVEYFMG